MSECQPVGGERLVPAALEEIRERLGEESVLDEAEDAYKSSPVGGRRALEAAFDAALEAVANAR